LVRYLRIDALERFRVFDFFAAAIAHGLGSAPLAQIRVVFPEVCLRFHGFHRFVFRFPHWCDVEQDLRLEFALFWLMRFEEEDGRGVERFAGRRIAERLRVDARFERDAVCGRMIGVVGIEKRMREHEFRLEFAILHDHGFDGFLRWLYGIVAGIEETDLGSENSGGASGFRAADFFDTVDRHAGLFPCALALAAFSEREAENADAVAS